MRLFITTISCFALMACESDGSLKIQNPTPIPEILSPEDGAEILEGIPQEFWGLVTDSNHSPEELRTTWKLNGEIVCEELPPTVNGDTFCSIALTGDATTVTLLVQDLDNASGTDSISVSAIPTEAPTAEILTPDPTQRYYADQKITFEGFVYDAEDSVEQLVAHWESDLDGVLSGVDAIPDNSGSVLGYEYLTEGEHAIELHVEDSTGKTDRDSVIIEVGPPNSIPLCEIIAPLSGSAGIEGDMVEFLATASDVDIDANLLTVIWSSDKDGEIGSSIPTSVGDISLYYDGLSANRHTITMQVSDELGETCTQAIDYAVGTPPEITIDSPLDGDVINDDSLINFTTTVSDGQDQPNEITLDWVLNGTSIETAVADSSGTTTLPSSTLVFGLYNLIVTATDQDGLSSTDQINFTVNGIPTTPVISIQPDPASTSDSLTINLDTPSTDPEGTNINYTYEWLLGGQVQTGYTSSSLPSSATTKGEQWTARITPDDGIVSGTSATTSITIQNTPPNLTSVSITPISGIYNDVVYTCSAILTDPDETPTITYEWSVNQTIIGNTNSINASAIGVLPEDILTCSVTATDSDNATATGSAQVTILNRAPNITNTFISPNSGITTSTQLFCSSLALDPDGETLNPTYTWTIGANSYSGSSLALNSSIVSPSDTVTCTVSATDSYGATATDSASVSLNNTAPVISNVNISYTGSLNSSSLLTCNYTASDADGDPLTASYAWTNLSSSTILSSTSDTLQLSPSMVGLNETIECSVTVMDTSGTTATLTDSVSIGNSDPYFTMAATITTTGLQTGDTWTCTAFGEDPEDGTLTPSYIWQDGGGAFVQSGSILTLSPSNSEPNYPLTCVATITDSAGVSVSSSASEIVQNSYPSTPSISISPSAPVAGIDNLVCTIASHSYDPDSQAISYSFSWFNSSGLQQSASIPTLSDTFSGANTSADTWTCQVTATDGIVSTNPVTASVVVSAGTTACQDHLSCGAGTYCTEWRSDGQFHCSPQCAFDFDCGTNETCSHLAGGANVRFCEPIPSNTLPTSSSCTLDSQCEDGLCVNGYCESVCGGEMDCGFTESCHAVGYYAYGELHASCAPHSTLADVGQSCLNSGSYSGDHCETGHCDIHQWDSYYGSSPAYCRPLCSKEADCDLSGPYPEVCGIVVAGPTAPSDSVPTVSGFPQPHSAITACYEPWNVGSTPTGSMCSVNSDCASNKCFNIMPNSSLRYCSALCEVDSDCSGGTTCQTASIDVANEWMLYHSGYSTQTLQSTTTLLRVCAF